MQFLLLSLALTAAAAPLHKRVENTNTLDSVLSSVQTEVSGTVGEVDGSLKRRNDLGVGLGINPSQLVDEADIDVDGVVENVKRDHSLLGDDPLPAETVYGVEGGVNEAELEVDGATTGLPVVAPVEGATADTISGVENGMNKELNTIDTQRRSNLLKGTEQAGKDVTDGLENAGGQLEQGLDLNHVVERQVESELGGVVAEVEAETEGLTGSGLGL